MNENTATTERLANRDGRHRSVSRHGQPVLQCFHSESERFDQAAQVREARVFWHGQLSGGRSDVGPLALPGDDQLVLLKVGERALHGSDGHAVVLGDGAVGRQLVTRVVLPLVDGASEGVGDLTVRGSRVIWIQLVHADKRTGLSQLRHLGDHSLDALPSLAMLSMFSSGASIAGYDGRSPGGAATPAGAHIETLGATMQFESTRLYRVKAIAEALDVSVATIYRAVEAGELAAFKIGAGKGAIRIPGHAVPAYLDLCGKRAAGVAGEVA